MKKKYILLVVIIILLTNFSCALFLSEREQSIKEIQRSLIETDERIVKNCQYLGTVQGSVDVGNTLLFFSQIRCKNRAKRSAALLGATHLVWLHVHKTSAVAMAYKCELKKELLN
ncbi:MAG: hypothetical protein KJO26_12910 [Deltaproteobacteria bacterium]|nr:hypothetical protein [Deltaproteobacteria bacterium]MBT8373833.1 hypothetical protein [Deltaproteobacteria bacterium]NNK85374.1 hypothetical protein [Desulfobacterales bacterium]